jgi:hypothetical protein
MGAPAEQPPAKARNRSDRANQRKKALTGHRCLCSEPPNASRKLRDALARGVHKHDP